MTEPHDDNEEALRLHDEARELIRQKRWSTALAVADTLIARWPHLWLGYLRRAQVLESIGEKDAALSLLDRVVALTPDGALGYFARAELLMDLERHAEAIGDFDAAERRDSGWFGSLIPLWRAECRIEVGDLEGADRDCGMIPDDFSFPPLHEPYGGSKMSLQDEIARRRPLEKFSQ
jgi:tetratricopeptide (TPR) repeat protein